MSPSFFCNSSLWSSVLSAPSVLILVFSCHFCLFQQRLSQISPRLRNQLLRFSCYHAPLQHHQRHSHIGSRRPQSVFRRRHFLLTRFRQNPQRPLRNLLIGNHHIDHQVLIHMPQPRHHRLHQARRSPKRRRTRRRIQHSHSPTRPRPHVKQPAPLSNPADNRLHRARNRRRLSSHGDCHFAVLAIHQPHNLLRRHAVQIPRRRIPLFRKPVIDKPISFEPSFFRPRFFQSKFRLVALRAFAFLGLGSHSRIIQAAEKSLGMAIPGCAVLSKATLGEAVSTLHRKSAMVDN